MDNDKEHIEKEIEEKNKKLMEEIEEREKCIYKFKTGNGILERSKNLEPVSNKTITINDMLKMIDDN